MKGKYIGLQIKPVSGVSHIPEIYKERNLQNKTHSKFTDKFGGKVFYIFSIKEGNKKLTEKMCRGKKEGRENLRPLHTEYVEKSLNEKR
jgi:hypothetical protein